MFGGGAGEDVDRRYIESKLGVVQSIQIGPGQHPSGVLQSDLRSDCSGSARMIAGDHLDPDTRRAAFGDGGNGLWSGRIDQANKTNEGQAVEALIRSPSFVGSHNSEMGVVPGARGGPAVFA